MGSELSETLRVHQHRPGTKDMQSDKWIYSKHTRTTNMRSKTPKSGELTRNVGTTQRKCGVTVANQTPEPINHDDLQSQFFLDAMGTFYRNGSIASYCRDIGTETYT